MSCEWNMSLLKMAAVASSREDEEMTIRGHTSVASSRDVIAHAKRLRAEGKSAEVFETSYLNADRRLTDEEAITRMILTRTQWTNLVDRRFDEMFKNEELKAKWERDYPSDPHAWFKHCYQTIRKIPLEEFRTELKKHPVIAEWSKPTMYPKTFAEITSWEFDKVKFEKWVILAKAQVAIRTYPDPSKLLPQMFSVVTSLHEVGLLSMNEICEGIQDMDYFVRICKERSEEANRKIYDMSESVAKDDPFKGLGRKQRRQLERKLKKNK